MLRVCPQVCYRREMLLKFIEDYVEREHYPPTIEEMRVGMGWSTKSLVVFHLDILEAEGRIERTRRVSRGTKPARNKSHYMPAQVETMRRAMVIQTYNQGGWYCRLDKPPVAHKMTMREALNYWGDVSIHIPGLTIGDGPKPKSPVTS